MPSWPRWTPKTAAAFAAGLFLTAPAFAAVERVDILERVPFAESESFGEAGA